MVMGVLTIVVLASLIFFCEGGKVGRKAPQQIAQPRSPRFKDAVEQHPYFENILMNLGVHPQARHPGKLEKAVQAVKNGEVPRLIDAASYYSYNYDDIYVNTTNYFNTTYGGHVLTQYYSGSNCSASPTYTTGTWLGHCFTDYYYSFVYAGNCSSLHYLVYSGASCDPDNYIYGEDVTNQVNSCSNNPNMVGTYQSSMQLLCSQNMTLDLGYPNIMTKYYYEDSTCLSDYEDFSAYATGICLTYVASSEYTSGASKSLFCNSQGYYENYFYDSATCANPADSISTQFVDVCQPAYYAMASPSTSTASIDKKIITSKVPQARRMRKQKPEGIKFNDNMDVVTEIKEIHSKKRPSHSDRRRHAVDDDYDNGDSLLPQTIRLRTRKVGKVESSSKVRTHQKKRPASGTNKKTAVREGKRKPRADVGVVPELTPSSSVIDDEVEYDYYYYDNSTHYFGYNNSYYYGYYDYYYGYYDYYYGYYDYYYGYYDYYYGYYDYYYGYYDYYYGYNNSYYYGYYDYYYGYYDYYYGYYDYYYGYYDYYYGYYDYYYGYYDYYYGYYYYGEFADEFMEYTCNSPFVLSPTAIPTVAPTKGKPTMQPTYQSNSLVVSAFQVIKGISSNQYYADEANNLLALQDAISSCVTGLTSSNVQNVYVTAHKATNGNSNNAVSGEEHVHKRLIRTGLSLTAVIANTVFTLGSPPSINASYALVVDHPSASMTYASISSQLQTAVQTGVFDVNLNTAAVTYGATAFTGCTSSSVSTSDESPEASSSSSSSNTLSTGAVAGISVVVILVGLGLLFGLGYCVYARAASGVSGVHTSERASEGHEMNATKPNIHVNPIVNEDDITLQKRV